MRPLSGLLILDFSTLLPGPLATLMLAESGAEVIKIERPDVGEDMRHFEPKWDTDGAIFALLNRGKKSVVLDLKDSKDRERLTPLLCRADIIVEQFRPGVMARLGLGYEQVASLNPKVIYCSISANGQTGPKRHRAGHDLNLLAESGLLALSMNEAADVVMPPTPIADIAGGSYPAVINILLALQERNATGRGRQLDIAIGDNLFPLAYWGLAHGWATGRWPGNRADLVTGASPRYRIYGTRDGMALAAAPLEQKFWEIFCETIDLPAALRDDLRDPAATIAAVKNIIAGQDAHTWRERFALVDCCCSIVTDLRRAQEDVHFRERGLFDHFVSNALFETMPALPVPIDPGFRAPSGTTLSAPPLGRDQSALLPAEIGSGDAGRPAAGSGRQ